jgi:hypothetical protein
MEEPDSILGRLERIGVLDRRDAPPLVLLGELQGLLREAEAWSRERTREGVVERTGTAPHGT